MTDDQHAGPLDRLLRRLQLERLDRDLYLGDPGRGSGRLFGGMVAAQSYLAAAATVEAGDIHSLHAYFLRPGRHDIPIRFVVDRIRDGRTFTTRRVVAHQVGEAIFSLEASFTMPEAGISHADAMPGVPEPETLPDWELVRPDRSDDAERRSARSPIDIRAVDTAGEPGAIRRVWMRPKGALPEDPVVHAAAVVFASDRGLLSTVARYHGLPYERTASASLDHALWFHRPPRWDGWLLYTTSSHAAHGGRALVFGTMYSEDGTLLASVAQEGLFRRPRDRQA
jgi:acyl-CoA thioesterase-2